MAALFASSPEYFERFRYMTRGEQVRAIAELATNLLVTTGAATATTRTMTGALAGAEATRIMGLEGMAPGPHNAPALRVGPL